jgi:uncharacterized protein YqgC (DUF456 family)
VRLYLDVSEAVLGSVVGLLVGTDVGKFGPVVGPNIGEILLAPSVGLTVRPSVGEAVVGVLVELVGVGVGVDVVCVGHSANV